MFGRGFLMLDRVDVGAQTHSGVDAGLVQRATTHLRNGYQKLTSKMCTVFVLLFRLATALGLPALACVTE